MISKEAAEALAAMDALDELRAKDTDCLTEDSVALAFRDRYAGELVYDHEAGAWYRWDSAYWKKEKTGVAFDWARALARELSQGEGKKTRSTLNRTGFARGVEKFCQCDRAFATTSEQWDLDHYLLGTPDGTVDLTTGLTKTADPNDKITRITTVAPADHADCPMWLKFLRETTGSDMELIRFMQQFAGYCLTGSVKEHALFFGYGPGGNGKGTFVNTIVGIMGMYATTAPMDTFTASYTDKHPTELAMLRGARMVTASETEEGRSWAENRIKQITGGDPITARFMRQDFFTFSPTFKLMLIGNYKPNLRNVDEAARRRFNIVPFTRTPAVKDLDLGHKLEQEWPTILRWMIDGCLDWRERSLVRPKSVRDATANYFASQDTFGQFLLDECVTGEKESATAKALFTRWTEFLTNIGEKPRSQKAFGQSLERLGFERGKDAQDNRIWRGISLKKPPGNYADQKYTT
jgi:putative DNA primase/helicase